MAAVEVVRVVVPETAPEPDISPELWELGPMKKVRALNRLLVKDLAVLKGDRAIRHGIGIGMSRDESE